MPDWTSHMLSALVGFFAIMNPIANTPLFISLTAADDSATRKAVAFRALVLSFLIVSAFCMTGQMLFELFGITLPAFRITGGLLIFLIGFQMLHGDHSPVQSPGDIDQSKSDTAALSVAVSPLAMPILAGPGTIATAIGYVAESSPAETIATIVAFGLLCVITFLFFISGGKLVRYLGEEAIRVVTRLMGLIIAVIGTQMLIEGIGGAVSAHS